MVGGAVVHPAEGKHQLLDHLWQEKSVGPGWDTGQVRATYPVPRRDRSSEPTRTGAWPLNTPSGWKRLLCPGVPRERGDPTGEASAHLAVELLPALQQEVGNGVEQPRLPQPVPRHVLGNEGHGVGGEVLCLPGQPLCRANTAGTPSQRPAPSPPHVLYSHHSPGQGRTVTPVPKTTKARQLQVWVR